MNLWDLVIVQPVFNVLLVLFNFLHDFGLALIVFTIIVKLALWPLMKKQLHQTRLMKKIQPELAEIKKRCRGNRQMETLQMMDLYKRNDVKPFRSILTLIIQLPIFIAIFSIVNMAAQGGGEVARYAYPFVQKLPLVSEAISNEGEFSLNLFGFIDLRSNSFPSGGVTVSAIILLVFVIVSAVLQYMISKQQMPSSQKKRTFKQIMADAANGKEADQTELNNMVSGQMTKLMPIMMFFVMIGLPGAVILYYMTTNVVGYIQQRNIFKQGFDEMDNIADKKLIRELDKIEEAQLVQKDSVYKKSGKARANVTKIVAKEKGKRRRKNG